MKYYWYLGVAILVFFIRSMSPAVHAVDCSFSQTGNVYTLQQNCQFGETVDGLDAGEGASNSAKLVVPTGTTLTVIDRSSSPQTLIVGSLQVEEGGTIINPEGSQIVIGQPICLTDSDTDGYIDNGTQSFVPFKASVPGTCVRKSIMHTRITEEGRQTIDCNSANASYTTECSSTTDLTQGSLNRITSVSTPSALLQDYYQEIGKDNGLVGLWHFNEPSDKSATGGTITTSGGYTIHTFTSVGSATFTPNFTGTVEVLVVGGGGGGAAGYGNGNGTGGGGAGGLVYDASYSVAADQAITVTVGDGGTGGTGTGTNSPSANNQGNNGNNSVFGTITAIGGGGGGRYGAAGNSGGSGGGNGGLGTAGQGNNGGAVYGSALPYRGGGGGGSSAMGATGQASGNGGAGTSFSISGSAVTYAGGGGGGCYTGYTAGAGTGGGGNGGAGTTSGGAGTANRGGGGGAGGWPNPGTGGNGGKGGSGVVIVRYLASSVTDSSDNGNTGTTTGTTVVDGRINKGRNFASGNYITVADANILSFPNRVMSISAWVKTSSATTQAIVAKGAASNWEYALRIENSVGAFGHWEAAGTASDPAYGTTTVTDGEWHHLVGVADNVFNYIYVDGKLEGKTAISRVWTNGTAPVLFGKRASAELFIGVMDEVAIWNRSLAPEEIALFASRRPWGSYTSSVIDAGAEISNTTLTWVGAGVGTRTYSTGTLTSDGGETPYSSVGLVAQWNFNETSGTTATNTAGADSCGGTPANCNGTLKNFTYTAFQDQAGGTGWTNYNKRWGQGALMFDGTNDYVEVPNTAALNITSTITLEAWVNPRVEQRSGIIAKYQQTEYPYILFYYGNESIPFAFRFQLSTGGGASAKTKPLLGQWYHVVATYDGAYSKIYINGKLETALAYTNPITTKAVPLYIGTYTGDGSTFFYFNGVIDVARVYSRALSPEEVLSNYNVGAIEMQWRAGSTTTPDSTDYAAGTNWTQWAPVGTAGYETQLDAMDSTQASWFWDINSAGNADGTTATSMPKAKAQDTIHKQEGTGSLKLAVGQPQADANTVGLWHMDEISGDASGATVETFLSSGTFTPPSGVNSVQVLVVAGGGGAGSSIVYNDSGHGGSGGGGGGGVVYHPNYAVTPGTPVTVTVGNGGAGGARNAGARGSSGGNSVFGTITAIGGGGGGSGCSSYKVPSCGSSSGLSGGSGGGAGWYTNASGYAYVAGAAGTTGQGNSGGGNGCTTGAGGGGGGGAGSNGSVPTNNPVNNGGTGGSGRAYAISGTNTYYGGGGGGAAISSGGIGGGGSCCVSDEGRNGVANTGGGGAGAYADTAKGGNGGSGIVIVKYAASDVLKDIKDSSGNNNHGASTEGVSIADGFFGKGRAITTGERISIPHSTSLNLTNNFTISAWAKFASAGVNNMIASKYAAQPTGWAFFRHSDNKFYMQGGNGTSWLGAFNCATSATWTDTAWHHVATTVGPSNVIIYVDGVAQATCALSAAAATNTTDVVLGGYNTISVYSGLLDEVHISNAVRSADQIAEEYRAGRDHRLTRVISSTDATSKTKLPFWIASDRLGTFAEMTVGDSAFANYEPDSNTAGLWHIEEKSGSGAYIKDSSANANNGTPAGVELVQGKIGKGLLFNKSTGEQLDMGSGASLDLGDTFTISAWINPTTLANYSNIVNKVVSPRATTYSYMLVLHGDGTLGTYSPASNWGFSIATGITTGKWYHVAWVLTGGRIYSYVNGQNLGSRVFSYTDTAAHNVFVGTSHNSGVTYNFNGLIDEVRMDSVARTAAEIRQAYEVGLRTHPITIDFKAALSETVGSSTTSFGIDETAYGSSQKANHIFRGDTIILRENIDGTEYMVQGRVDTVNAATGALTVTWESGQTWPTNFTTNATVFKWQREWMDLTGIPVGTGAGDVINAKDALTRLTLRLTDTSQGANIWLDDMRVGGPYINTSPQSVTISPAKQYLQLRALFSTADIATSSGLSTFYTGTINPTLTPTPTPIP